MPLSCAGQSYPARIAAREVAAETLADVKRAMKIDYFDDKELIASQAEHFAHKE